MLELVTLDVKRMKKKQLFMGYIRGKEDVF